MIKYNEICWNKKLKGIKRKWLVTKRDFLNDSYVLKYFFIIFYLSFFLQQRNRKTHFINKGYKWNQWSKQGNWIYLSP